MGQCTIKPGGYRGIDPEECTANKEQVLVGYKAGVKGEDDPIDGAMHNLSAESKIMHAANNSAKVIAGDAAFLSKNTDGVTRVEIRHNNGDGYITNNTLFGIDQSAIAQVIGLNSSKLAAGNTVLGVTGDAWVVWTGDATAADSHVLKGDTYWSNGVRHTGTMPLQNKEIEDRAYATQISAWNGTVCLGVRANHYLNGVNWIQGNIPTLAPENIKKGVNIGGVVGTFEGYTTSAADIYRKGAVNPNYPLSLYAGAFYEDDDGNTYQAITEYRSDTIYVYTTYNNYWSNSIVCTVPINLTPISNIYISLRGADGTSSGATDVVLGVYESLANSADRYVKGLKTYYHSQSTYQTLSINVSDITRPLYIGFWATCTGHVKMEIDHIWFD